MYLEDIRAIKPSQYGPYTTIQAAIAAALAASPLECVIIPPDYAGTDTYTNASGVAIFDLRQGSSSAGLIGIGTTQVTGGTSTSAAVVVGSTGITVGTAGAVGGGVTVGGVKSGIAAVAGAAAPITSTTGGVFVTTLSLPGSSAYEQVPFTVKASGYVSLAAGTYTASVQPLLYASSLAGYTASAAAAIFSAAAVSITYAAAAATVAPFELEAYLVGDSTSHKLTGRSQATAYVAGATLVNALVAPAIITNPLTVFTASAAIPVQFLVGVTMVSANAASVINLGSFFIES